MVRIRIEVCAFSLDACLAAGAGGADRIELCSDPVQGGTTPSHGLTRAARERVGLDIFPIIRPRAGNYCYSDDEFAVLLAEVAHFRELGCNGVSVGVQRLDGTIDVERMRRIRDAAGPLGCTCNRAFDLTPDPREALEDLIRAGFDRVLTSGQASYAPEAAELLGELVRQAGDRIIVMPGSGVRPENLPMLIARTGAREYHTAARRYVPNAMTFQNPRLLDLGQELHADQGIIREMRRICDRASGG
ncbi:MAG TPA: copper homeostasis protein CutC [Planctomycetota bacterium]|nr:copper homeostasis protein CutC [Planctomycetota bacterium]